ncbi:hypothetical protein IAR50_007040 [Cryptococcus sp. DSM 104548]
MVALIDAVNHLTEQIASMSAVAAVRKPVPDPAPSDSTLITCRSFVGASELHEGRYRRPSAYRVRVPMIPSISFNSNPAHCASFLADLDVQTLHWFKPENEDLIVPWVCIHLEDGAAPTTGTLPSSTTPTRSSPPGWHFTAPSSLTSA